MKLLSIIVPLYNMEDSLDRCLTSLLLPDAAMMQQLEVLVINDGSTDGSRAVALNYQARYPETFRVIDKTNGNYGSCINVALYLAQGKFIKTLDTDDYFKTETLAQLMTLLAQTDADCVLTDMEQLKPDGSTFSRVRFALPVGTVFGLDQLGDAAWNMWVHCVCYRLQAVRDIFYRQTEGIYYTDQEFICLPMSAMQRIVYLPQVLYCYRVGRPSQTIDPNVWDKHFYQEIQGCKVMISQEQLLYAGCTQAGHDYIRKRIAKRVEVIYDAYFTRFSTYDNHALMVEFDRYLKAYDADLYNRQDQARICKFFYYVRRWRRDYRSDTFYLRLVRFLAQKMRRLRYGA